jgi:hypothetical protein
MTRIRRRARDVALTAALVAALTLGASGCSGDDEPAPESTPSASGAPAAAPLTTTAKIGQVTGGPFPAARREELKDRIRPVVDAWIDGAYVGGTWPRTEVGDAFSGFSAGARADAKRDLRVMSNLDVGDRLTSVSATHRTLFLDVLTVRQRAAAVTARLLLRFDTAGEVARTETVRARLFLTRGGAGWEVFGYDVSAGDGAAGSGATGRQERPKSPQQEKQQKKSRRSGR